MKIKRKVLQKIISFASTVLILLNSFTPYLLIAPTFSQVKAESTATSEASVETVTPTPTVGPTSTPTLTPTTTPSQWTFEKVELNKEYVSPQNSEVKLTFTKLPNLSGNIKIEEITLTEDQIKQTGSLSNKAYDITSDMKDGDFSYNLSLPIPESSKGKSVEVKFAEEISNIDSAERVENTLTKTDTSVSVANLDHMTIFVVTVVVLQPDYSTPGGGGVYSAYYGPPSHSAVSPGSTSVYDGREAGIIKAGQGTNPGSSGWDEGLFAFKPTVTIDAFAAETVTYDVENQVGINPVWMTIEIDTGTLNDRSDNTTYQFVPTSNPAGWHTVDAGAGQWQKWNNNAGDTTGNPLMSLSAVANAHSGLNVVRAYLRLGMGDSYYNGGTGTIAWVDKATFGGETYDFSITSVTTNDATGIISNDATLNGFNKSDATGHSFWVSLAPFITTSPSIPAGVYSSPDLGSIAANTDFSVSLASITTTGVPTNLPAITPGTTYYFAAWSLVGGTWYPGEIKTFTTANGPVFIDTNINDVLDSGELSFNTIQDAISAATSGDTIYVTAGTYTEVGQIVINKNLSIVGEDKTTTIIKPAQNTGSSGDSRGWILVNPGISFSLKNMTLDGEGKLVNIGILSHGPGTIDSNIIKNIGYNPSGPDYAGRGIAFYDVDTTITNNIVQNYGRIGIYKYGSGTTLIEGNTIEGKGTGDHLDYAVEIEGGATAEIKGNTISNNKGVASVDGSTSAGIMATTYFASGTNLKIINNSIHDNAYGVAIGYDNDTTSVSQFDGNIFSGNDHDFDNYTVNNVDARNNIWSVADQDNLDQIEAKINHYCSGSTYVHGICSGTDDYGTGFGMVQYKNIGTLTNSGWNLRSKSTTPNETPLDLACGEYSKENSVAQNWTAVSGANIKYQREVTFPSNAVSYFEAGSNTYTPFSTFGSGTGIEGLWKTKVRAYVDANSNNKYDSGEEVSVWSNECQITFDKTNPTDPEIPSTTPNPTNNTLQNWLWLSSTDIGGSGVKGYYQSIYDVLTSGGSVWSWIGNVLGISTNLTDGEWQLQLKAEDNAGNVSGVVSSATLTVDTTPPSVPNNLKFTNPNLTCGATTNIKTVTVDWSDSTDNVGIAGYDYNIDYPLGAGRGVWNTFFTNSQNRGTLNEGIHYIKVRAKDTAGNVSSWTDPLCSITYDSIAPTGTITYSTTALTNGDVVATLVPSETVTVTNNGGSTNYTFTANGTFTFNFSDLAGNTGSATATVSNIDKTAPAIPTGIYYRDTVNNKDVACGEKTNTKHLDVYWTANLESDFDHYEYISFNANGSAGPIRTFTTNYFNASWWTIPTEGTYGVQIKAVDKAGNKSDWFGGSQGVENSCKYIVDWTVPTITVNNFITNDNTPKLTGTVNDNTATISVNVDGKTFTATNKGDGTWELANDTITPALTDNVYNVIASATDTAGNIGADATTNELTVDTVAPRATYKHYIDGTEFLGTIAYVNNVNKLTFTGEYSDANPSSQLLKDSYVIFDAQTDGSFKFSQNGAKAYCGWRTEPNLVDLSGNPFSLTVNESFANCKSNLGEGEYYMTHQVYDNAVRKDIPSITQFRDVLGLHFIIDKTAPVITVNNPNTLPSQSKDLTASVSDGTLTMAETTGTICDNSLSFVSYSDKTYSAESDNGKRICYQAQDTADNFSYALSGAISGIDTTKPSSTITTPENSGDGSTEYMNDWNGAISGTATDSSSGSGVKKVKLSIKNIDNNYWDGEDWSSTVEVFVDATGTTTWNYNLPTPIEGSYTIKSHAIDNAGNEESTYTLTVILDKTIPEVTISLNPAVADASNGWYKTQPEITLTATDEHKDIVEYQWGSQTGAWTTYSAPFKPGSEGEYVLYYRARDLANNYSGVGIKNIKWDQTELTDGPLNVSVSPNPTSGTTSVVKWETAKDNIGIDRYEVKWSLKNGDKSYTDSVGSDIREHTINNLIEGDWTIEVKAFDGSGKSKSASTDLTVDRTGPSAPTLSIFGTSVGSVSLSWSKVDGANNYIIWYGTNPGSYQYGAKVGDVQSYTVQGLGAGSYYFIVKAMDPAGNQSGNSNEVSTGTIVGAPGVAENTPAEGFTENVLGEATGSAKLTPTGSVLGTTKANGKKKIWWWPWILLLLLPPAFWFGYKKWKKV